MSLLKVLFSIPKTLWFNLRYLPFSQGVRLPVWLAANVRIPHMHRGGVMLRTQHIKPAMIRIGFHEAYGDDIYARHTILNVHRSAKIIFRKDAHIGHGAILCVVNDGVLDLGENFAISGTTSIITYKEIRIGANVQFAWNSLVMDSDAHTIIDTQGNALPNCIPVRIGDHVWIASNVTILKGTEIGDNCVVAANSLCNKTYQQPNRIIAGSPAKEIKEIGSWKL